MNAKRFVVGFVCGFGSFALIPVARGDLSKPTPLDLSFDGGVVHSSFNPVFSAAATQSSPIDFAPADAEARVLEFIYTSAAPWVHVDLESLDLFSSDVFQLTHLTDTPRDYAWRSTNQMRRQQSGSPGGLAWALSGMLSIGVLQVGRGVHHLHFAAGPEWYHTSGLSQVGHTTPFELEWWSPTLVSIGFTGCAEFDAPFACRLRPGQVLFVTPTEYCITIGPRAPPASPRAIHCRGISLYPALSAVDSIEVIEEWSKRK